jgi:chemotaxis protein MotB
VSLGQDLSSLKTQAGALSADLTAKQQQIADLLKAQEAARQRAAMYRNLVAKFQSMISSGQLQVAVRKGRMIVQMSDKILFDPGKDQLKKEGQAALMEVTKILATIPDRHFQVAGHTDNKPIKTARFKSNWELSTARAVNVVKFMGEQGMDSVRLSAAGYGPFDPVGDNNTDEGRQLNRRIEITLMPSIEELPKIE